jgi:CRISPR/Cas system-associated exonuclease Cas4 (RecB family)
MAQSRLSKSRLLSFLQCPKRMWLEVHRPELAQITAARQALFDTGHRVGEVARSLYSRGRNVRVERAHDLASPGVNAQLQLFAPADDPQVGATRLAADAPRVYFEATFEHGGVLIRTDVLEQSATGTRLIEVKAGAHMKDEYIPDVAIQTWVLEGAGVRVSETALAHVNDQFVYRGGGEYTGLLTEQPIGDLVRRAVTRVPEWTHEALGVIGGPEPTTPIGQRCRTPFECPYIHYC